MATVLRFARFGAKKKPYYHLVATNSRSPRDSKIIEKLGTFNPLSAKDSADRFKINEDRVKHWLSVGAQPSEKVGKLLSAKGLYTLVIDYTRKPKKSVKKPDKFGAAEIAAPVAAAAAPEVAAPEAPAAEAAAS